MRSLNTGTAKQYLLASIVKWYNTGFVTRDPQFDSEWRHQLYIFSRKLYDVILNIPMRAIKEIEILKWDDFVRRQVDFWVRAGTRYSHKAMDIVLSDHGKNRRDWVVLFYHQEPGLHNFKSDTSYVEQCNKIGGDFIFICGFVSFDAFATNDPSKVHLLRLCYR